MQVNILKFYNDVLDGYSVPRRGAAYKNVSLVDMNGVTMEDLILGIVGLKKLSGSDNGLI